ncbi:hypothetical protein LTSEWAN_1380 [Salmonella enterica subsp. enterica serovar Wandsworth str. A4-580]|uniref:Uncharacterized protein n=1 Tax=Salmonella enterica subsp. enterica serovar Wandsworth str. A4-580 TaxID=913086 RepID=G5S8W4_SALET|nr:hypothetical protein LTSEWAN_1380 [Salmonella enterica subsp. enterica serovar Wandsworth str. A4-580]
MSKLCGKQFWLAFCEAKDVTRAIKNGAIIEAPADTLKMAARILIRNARQR